MLLLIRNATTEAWRFLIVSFLLLFTRSFHELYTPEKIYYGAHNLTHVRPLAVTMVYIPKTSFRDFCKRSLVPQWKEKLKRRVGMRRRIDQWKLWMKEVPWSSSEAKCWKLQQIISRVLLGINDELENLHGTQSLWMHHSSWHALYHGRYLMLRFLYELISVLYRLHRHVCGQDLFR